LSEIHRSGVVGEMLVNKKGGSWVYWGGVGFATPGLEVNDAGFLPEVDKINVAAGLGRQWVRPGRLARQANVDLRLFQGWNFGGVRFGTDLNLTASLQTHRFSAVRFQVSRKFAGFDDRLTRGGPLMRPPATTTVSASYSTDSRRLLSAGLSALRWQDSSGTSFTQGSLDLTLQTRRGAGLVLSPSYQRARYSAFYVGEYADPTATATFGRRFLFSDLSQDVLSLSIRLNYYFTPTLSLQLYAQPFVATADFGDPTALAAARTYRFSRFGTAGSTVATDPATGRITVDADADGPAPALAYDNPDFRRRSLRSNAVLRWEYRPGSTLFLVWNQSRFDQVNDPDFRPFHDLRGIFGDDMHNVFLAKATYYFAW
jgi:hypothetical protein